MPRRSRRSIAALAVAGALLAAGWLVAQEEPPGLGPGYAGEEVCAGCHEELVAATAGQVHMRLRPFEVQGRTVGCEGCHGPGAAHADSADPADIRGFGEAAPGADACMGCHRTKGLRQWHGSTHALEDVDCTACHSIHQESTPLTSCRTCHADVEAQFQLPSHHPVREERMSCTSCHDVHAATEGALDAPLGRANDLCFTCHQAIEGPFLFEHPPVMEDCSLCHDPHGTVANNLLAVNEPVLCLQCHDFHFHAGYRAADAPEVDVGGFERENPWGPPGMNIAFTTKCTQCHTQIHGSDLPSQTVTSGGAGLTR